MSNSRTAGRAQGAPGVPCEQMAMGALEVAARPSQVSVSSTSARLLLLAMGVLC